MVVAPVLFIPGLETVSLDTQLILPIFIPPLLWSLARRTSWGMIRAQVHVVLVMSVALGHCRLPTFAPNPHFKTPSRTVSKRQLASLTCYYDFP